MVQDHISHNTTAQRSFTPQEIQLFSFQFAVKYTPRVSFAYKFVALRIIYHWDIFAFSTVPVIHWNTLTDRRRLMDDLAKKLGVTSNEGWYGVTVSNMNQYGLSALLAKYNGSLMSLLADVYPEYVQ